MQMPGISGFCNLVQGLQSTLELKVRILLKVVFAHNKSRIAQYTESLLLPWKSLMMSQVLNLLDGMDPECDCIPFMGIGLLI